MSKDQKGFVVYGDIEYTLDELTDEQVAKLFRGMVGYFNRGKDPKFTGVLKFVFIPIKQQMDRNAEKYEARCEKNRANANKRWGDMQSDAIGCDRINKMRSDAIDANTNTKTETGTDTKTGTDTESVPDPSSLSSELIRYLNEKTGSSYRPSRADRARIQNLLKTGYTPNQLRTVIDKKCAEWLGDDKMRSFLRPSTLFGDKFDEYLNAPISLKQEREQKRSESAADLRRKLEEKRNALASMTESIEDLRGEDGRFGDNLEEYRLLADQKAILEDSIRQIEKRLEAS